MPNSTYLYCKDLPQPLRLTKCGALAQHFPILFQGWHFVPGQRHDNPAISIEFAKGRYRVATAWQDEVNSYQDPVDTLCALSAKLSKACSFSDLDTLYLHAAAVEINGRLVAFPNRYRAGKSFLSVCLAAAGHKFFCDDVLPLTLDSCQGRSAGFAPRLRLPLPPTTDSQSQQFIESCLAIKGQRYAYLNLSENVRHPYGSLVDLGAYVILERKEGITPSLEEVSTATILKQLIWQNFARDIDGSRILSALTKSLSQVRCLRLRFDRADEAIALLEHSFSEWPDLATELSPKIALEPRDQANPANLCAMLYLQNENTEKVQIEGETFLVSPNGRAIYHLNSIGSGIWNLLSEPSDKNQVVSLLKLAFPNIDAGLIENDVAAILLALHSKNLITRTDS